LSATKKNWSRSDKRFFRKEGTTAMGAQAVQLDVSRRSAESRHFEAALRRRIVAQEEAVQAVVDLYQVFGAGLNSPGRPVGNLLFLGPTGTGKTRVVEATAEVLYGDPRAVIKVDCAEFQHSHEIAKLIGSPPGYLGHRETHPLVTQEALAQYHTDKVKISHLLFDEIEKASDALWQLLLGILDKATLTLGDKRRVDFSQTMIFMTSNLAGGRNHGVVDGRAGICAFVASGIKAEAGREGRAHGGGSGQAEILAGVHEPHRQSGGVPSAAIGAARTNTGDQVGHGTAARSGNREWTISASRDARGAGIPAARGNRSTKAGKGLRSTCLSS
jgi:AAA domain (Cdc48 subfamily)